MFEKLKKDQSLETMSELKEVEKAASKMVDDKERLAGKLEPEIIQWEPLQKLIRRDEELEFVQTESGSIKEYLGKEL